METLRDRTGTEERFSELMERYREGDMEARDELYELIYGKLREIAAHLMRHQPPGHTLQVSDLVGEAYLRLGKQRPHDRAHFFALAATAMRCALVDHARSKRTGRRSPSGVRVPLEDLADAFEARSGGLVELDLALERLGRLDAHYVRIVELRFFACLPEAEIAKLLGIPLRNLQRDWQFARDWLLNEIKRDLG